MRAGANHATGKCVCLMPYMPYAMYVHALRMCLHIGAHRFQFSRMCALHHMAAAQCSDNSNHVKSCENWHCTKLARIRAAHMQTRMHNERMEMPVCIISCAQQVLRR